VYVPAAPLSAGQNRHEHFPAVLSNNANPFTEICKSLWFMLSLNWSEQFTAILYINLFSMKNLND
jgi:hypothetical protein